MLNAYSISQSAIVGIYLCAAFAHGLVYVRLRNAKVHGMFALLCLAVAAYSITNISALHFSLDLGGYTAISKLSSVFAMSTFVALAYFVSAYSAVPPNRVGQVVALTLLPFFVLNLLMENGILWSSLEGLHRIPGPWNSMVNKPVGAVISAPMYGLWVVSVAIYLWLSGIAYRAMTTTRDTTNALLFVGFVMVSIGLIHDILLDMGKIVSSVYLSEYLLLAFVVAMSLRLSDELYRHKVELEAMVMDRTEKLQEAARDLEAFSYSISHDLRAPLRAITGFAKAIQEEDHVPRDSVGRDYFERIIRNAQRMDEMIIGLLQLARVSQKDIVRSRVDLTQLAKELSGQLAEQNPDRTVSVEIEANIVVRADPIGARVILINLFENAWKFTRYTPNANVAVRRYSKDSEANGFVFSDNGAGFDQERADKLFVPFQRLHSAEEYPGFGIGLATVARIVKRHRGNIRAEGAKGKGATFYVFLGD